MMLLCKCTVLLAFFLCCNCDATVSDITTDYFFIYEWPTVPINVYPPPNADIPPGASYSHAFGRNNGYGEAIDTEIGLYQTWQFSLFRNLFNRLRVHPLRTRDPSKAKAFIIPFDIAVHNILNQTNGAVTKKAPITRGEVHQYFYRPAGKIPNYPHINATIDPLLLNPAGEKSTLKWKAKKRPFDLGNLPLGTGGGFAGPSSYDNYPLYWKNNGRDHYVIISTTIFHKFGTPTHHVINNVCIYCQIISIETNPTKTPFHLGSNLNYIHALPYPSSFHYNEDIRTYPWVAEATAGLSAGTGVAVARDIISLFVGSIKTSVPNASRLRATLYAQCKEFNTRLNMNGNSKSRSEKCVWQKAAHDCTGLLNVTLAVDTTAGTGSEASKDGNVMRLFMRSVFCPAPWGDSYTRKSLFDSILSGCIPVIFTRISLLQYNWYLSEKEVNDISVYIPLTDVMDYGKRLNFMDILAGIPTSVIRQKQSAIEKIAPRLQYSVVPSRLGVYDYLRTRSVISNDPSIEVVTWSPPFKDAVDVLVENILSTNIVSTLNAPLISKKECFEIDAFNNYLRKYHEDLNGQQYDAWQITYQAIKQKRKRDLILNRKIEEIPQALVNYMRKHDIDDNSTFPWPKVEYNRGYYPQHMLEIGHIDIHHSDLLQRFRKNINIPYIHNMFE